MNLVLLGPPGSGKGTQGEGLNEDLRLPYYATGDILRRGARDGTELGKNGKGDRDRGALVPDEVIGGVTAERIDSEEARDGFILDGFPRTTPQAEALDARLGELGGAGTPVLVIDVSDEEVVRRLGGRRTCEAEGHVYHVEFNPPKVEGICDIDGSPLIIRDDDKPDVIRKRLATYHEKTEPLVTYYDDRGVLRRVDGERDPDEVTEELRRTLATMRLEGDGAV